MKDKDNGGLIVQGVVTLFILAVFTYYAFLAPQVCDIDKVYLWCRVHPMTTLDWIGAVLFYGCGLVFGGITEWLGIRLTSSEGSNTVNYVVGGLAILGAILMWV